VTYTEQVSIPELSFDCHVAFLAILHSFPRPWGGRLAGELCPDISQLGCYDTALS
jgi:hypothetical protein